MNDKKKPYSSPRWNVTKGGIGIKDKNMSKERAEMLQNAKKEITKAVNNGEIRTSKSNTKD